MEGSGDILPIMENQIERKMKWKLGLKGSLKCHAGIKHGSGTVDTKLPS